jgi:hypothetical protein
MRTESHGRIEFTGSVRFEPCLNERNAFQSVVKCWSEHVQLRYNDDHISVFFTKKFHDEYPSRIWKVSITESKVEVTSYTDLKGNPMKGKPHIETDGLLTNFSVPSALTVKGDITVLFCLV